jgi:ankyrin repeat protein
LFLDPPYHEDLTEEELTTWVSLLVQGSADGTPVDILNALAHGVDLTTELTFPPNQYPLHLACQKGSLICVYLLVMNGIDILERNESGLSGFEIAEFHGHKEIAALLKKRLDVMRTLPKYKNETMAIASTTAMSNPVAETPIEGNEQASSPPGPASDNDSVRLDSKQISSFSQLESSQETTTDFTSPDPDNPFYDEDLKMI